MNSSTFVSALSLPTPPLELNPLSLCAALEQVSDGRGKKGRLYRGCVVLSLVVLAKLAGQTTPSGIARWVRLRGEWLCQVFKLKSGRLPCLNTYIYLCQKVELAELNAVLAQFFSSRSTSAPPRGARGQATASVKRGNRQLALDGKAIVSTLKATQPACTPVHLLELYEVESGQVLRQLNVEKKESEVTVAPRLLEGQNLEGCLISADAFHTQREWCRLVKQKGADWLVLVKANQPELLADLTLMFRDEENWPNWLEKRTARSGDKGHGRIERRRLTISCEMKEFLEERWIGVEQVFRLERWISKNGQERYEVVYGMLSLPPQLASAEQVLEYVRRHWWIENRLHWRKDVTLGEDKCLSRRGQTPQVLAALNNLVLGLMDYLKVKNVPQQMARFDANPATALNLLLANIFL